MKIIANSRKSITCDFFVFFACGLMAAFYDLLRREHRRAMTRTVKAEIVESLRLKLTAIRSVGEKPLDYNSGTNPDAPLWRETEWAEK